MFAWLHQEEYELGIIHKHLLGGCLMQKGGP